VTLDAATLRAVLEHRQWSEAMQDDIVYVSAVEAMLAHAGDRAAFLEQQVAAREEHITQLIAEREHTQAMCVSQQKAVQERSR
jgi:hypothetical protein